MDPKDNTHWEKNESDTDKETERENEPKNSILIQARSVA